MMTTDLTMLVWATGLTVVQLLVFIVGALLQVGVPVAAGNRQNLPEIVGWAGRAQRAHRNMLENLVLFAILVLVANVSGKADATTALGAQLFFWGRLAYAPIYVIGIPWVRTAAFMVAMAGLVLIFLRLI